MQLFANNADSSLNGAIASDTVVLVLKAGEGSKFPSPANGDFFLVTLFKRVGTTELNHEIVKCTSRVGDNLTVVRAQEGTSAKPFNSGDLVELRITKGTVENFPQTENLSTKEPVIAAPVSAPTEKYWRGDKTWRDFFTDVRAATLTGLSTATNAVVAATDTVLAAIGKLQAQVTNKVDKVAGKGLSTEDYTTEEKVKLAGMVGGGNTTPYANTATATTAVPYGRYRLTASLDLTLPPAPTDGDWVDVVNTSGTTTARILRNAQNINGLAEDLTIDANYAAFRLVYRTGYGWFTV